MSLPTLPLRVRKVLNALVDDMTDDELSHSLQELSDLVDELDDAINTPETGILARLDALEAEP